MAAPGQAVLAEGLESRRKRSGESTETTRPAGADAGPCRPASWAVLCRGAPHKTLSWIDVHKHTIAFLPALYTIDGIHAISTIKRVFLDK